jgi:hypothetical protein
LRGQGQILLIISGLCVLVIAFISFPRVSSPTWNQMVIEIIVVAIGGTLASIGLQGTIGIERFGVKATGGAAVFLVLIYLAVKFAPNSNPNSPPPVHAKADGDGAGAPITQKPGDPPSISPKLPSRPTRPESACDLYRHQKTLAPKKGQTWNAKNLKEAESELQEGLKHWRPADKDCSKQDLETDLGDVLLEENKHEEAKAYFMNLVAEPDLHAGTNDFVEYPAIYHGLAKALQALGAPKRGIDVANNVGADPNNACRHYDLATYLDEVNRDPTSVEFHAKLKELQRAEADEAKPAPYCDLWIHKDLGCAYAAMGDAHANQELATFPPPDPSGVNYCRAIVHLPPLPSGADLKQ